MKKRKGVMMSKGGMMKKQRMDDTLTSEMKAVITLYLGVPTHRHMMMQRMAVSC